MRLYEEQDPNSENQRSFGSPCFLAEAEKAIGHGIDALKLEGNSTTWFPAVGDADVEVGERVLFPLRPSQPDCAFYLRTGYCKYGSFCRFNHPREKRVVQGRNKISTEEFQIIKERDKGFPKVGDRCKFYLMPGGCRFGEACRFSHGHEIAESVPVELNVLGLPLRTGEIECSYYMRTGICKYYSSCKFHHPEPSSVAGLHVFGYQSSSSLQNSIGPLHLPVTSQTLMTASKDSGSKLDILHPYMPSIPSEWLKLYKDQIRYQDASLPSLSERTSRHPSAIYQNGLSKPVDSLIREKEIIDNRKEFGESESQKGIRYEGFRLALPCMPNHTKDHLSESEACLLSPIGLPQRPDHPVCIYYGRFGICKYGPACKFDHPVDDSTQQSIHVSSPVMTRSTEEMEGDGSLALHAV